MAHSISAIVTKKTNLLKDTCFTTLPQGFAILVDNEQNRKALDGQDFVAIWTDYVGGSGVQGCTLFRNELNSACDKRGLELTKTSGVKIKMDRINYGLTALGVVRGDSDEFDALGIGRYRDNKDIQLVEIKMKKLEWSFDPRIGRWIAFSAKLKDESGVLGMYSISMSENGRFDIGSGIDATLLVPDYFGSNEIKNGGFLTLEKAKGFCQDSEDGASDGE